MRRPGALLVLVVLATAPALAQSKRPAPPKAAPSAAARRVEPADMNCPARLGVGLKTGRQFCDVLVVDNPDDAIVVCVPPRVGPAVLTFDLHNRHTYSEQLTRAGRAYTRYTATVAVRSSAGEVLARGVVQSEFRTVADMFDRVRGDLGPTDVKAVGPSGLEPIRVELPEGVDTVAILGEHLEVVRLDGVESFRGAGRLIASISNVTVDYQPPPSRAPARRRRSR
jgi:hypothetical protein